MIKVYGMDTCPDCVEVKKQIKDNDEIKISVKDEKLSFSVK